MTSAAYIDKLNQKHPMGNLVSTDISKWMSHIAKTALMDIATQLSQRTQMRFVPETANGNLCFVNNNDELRDDYKTSFAPMDILDHLYALLHSSRWQGEPFPTDVPDLLDSLPPDLPKGERSQKYRDRFWQLVKLGRELRRVHLLESPIVERSITEYPIDGDNMVGIPRYKDGKVYINDTQYFHPVPQAAWAFCMDGHSPAEKWLRDRHGHILSPADKLHYQKIIAGLLETLRLVKEIDRASSHHIT